MSFSPNNNPSGTSGGSTGLGQPMKKAPFPVPLLTPNANQERSRDIDQQETQEVEIQQDQSVQQDYQDVYYQSDYDFGDPFLNPFDCFLDPFPVDSDGFTYIPDSISDYTEQPAQSTPQQQSDPIPSTFTITASDSTEENSNANARDIDMKVEVDVKKEEEVEEKKEKVKEDKKVSEKKTSVFARSVLSSRTVKKTTTLPVEKPKTQVHEEVEKEQHTVVEQPKPKINEPRKTINAPRASSFWDEILQKRPQQKQQVVQLKKPNDGSVNMFLAKPDAPVKKPTLMVPLSKIRIPGRRDLIDDSMFILELKDGSGKKIPVFKSRHSYAAMCQFCEANDMDIENGFIVSDRPHLDPSSSTFDPNNARRTRKQPFMEIWNLIGLLERDEESIKDRYKTDGFFRSEADSIKF